MAALLNFFHALGEYTFLQNALIAGAMIGLIAGIIGAFSILQGTALIGDAMSHAVLPGIAIAALMGIPYYWGAGVFGLLAALVINFISEQTPLKTDAAIGLTFSTFFALGTIIMTAGHSTTKLTDILFGNILAVSSGDLISSLVIGLIVIAVVTTFYRELYLTTFDRSYAQAQGIHANLFRNILVVLITLVIIVALRAVGVILVTALLITPAASARLLVKRFQPMIWLSAVFGLLSAFVGLFLSYIFDWPSGPAIVVTGAVIFIISFLIHLVTRRRMHDQATK
ncbi:metal ABC transporter permease [Weissella confusa]|uniref:metal ABC transporter permease n=1 Tax=Weissella confusa TaxID=1583 RepID=UPI0022E049A0|nr:metal ABC transporter permease [Weissella confusa]